MAKKKSPTGRKAKREEARKRKQLQNQAAENEKVPRRTRKESLARFSTPVLKAARSPSEDRAAFVFVKVSTSSIMKWGHKNIILG